MISAINAAKSSIRRVYLNTMESSFGSEQSEMSWRSFLNPRQLRVEPFVLLYMVGYSLSAMAVSQLVQDKLCRVDYEQAPAFCISINKADFDHGGEKIKSDIITDGAYITLYRTLLSTLPCIVWAVFLGPWSDNYVNGRKFIMIAGASAAALESVILIINATAFYSSAYYVLFSFIPSALSGGIIATLMAIYAYCSATSTNATRSFRFAIVEICFWIAQPIGSFIGGQILGNGDETKDYQLYNYIPVFVVSLCAHIAAITWAILVIDEKTNGVVSPEVFGPTPQVVTNHKPAVSRAVDVLEGGDLPERDHHLDPDVTFSTNNADQDSLISESTANLTRFSLTRLSSESRKLLHQFVRLFDLDNVRELCTTLSKNRPHWGRGQIWILFISTAFLLLAYLNTTFILWSYVEKLYSWPPKFYSNVTSGVAIATLILMGFVLPIFVRVLKFGDMRLSLLGVISLLAQCILRGSWQHEPGLYLSFIAGTLAPLSFIGIRSRLSKIIADDERGKLFALLATVEAITPGIASLFYSVVFSISIDVYPGLVFQLAAFILLIPLLAIIFIDVYCVYDYDRSQIEQ